ncbi:MAG: alpha/beta hydrolase-fold protein [Prevotella conceptionensis]|jgi:hypothetical protein|uniref:alpha/beta hydrolase-fold protein n=1 Tax=Prevotella conceptionensis TaxID=340486 RepID=UPI0002FEB453|nr:alpha/beta hydrolase-fold protein [Prevotella conceptionensis]
MKQQIVKHLFLLYAFICMPLHGQETYASLTRAALETMWQSADSATYKKSLAMYEHAFSLFPDSIEDMGLYKASVLAGYLNEKDKAFNYLNRLFQLSSKLPLSTNWRLIIGEYAQDEYANLLSDPRWSDLKNKALKAKQTFYDDLKAQEKEFYVVDKVPLNNTKDGKALYSEMKKKAGYLPKQHQNYSLTLVINDTARTAFFVHLPPNYNPAKRYPLLFFLHGAVRNNLLTDYLPAAWVLYDWNRYYTKYAELNDVILVFPQGSKEFNWMTSDKGFFMVPKILTLVKKAINVDDNKVFITGHSNGATGSFSYLMKQPTPFAGFYGFNTQPKVFTGGTFVENIKNRSFINFSTDKDYYYPPNANDDFTKLMNSINADYKEYRYNGFPHWFPEFDESEPAYKILFADLLQRQRNPFPKEISWEFDDNRYGNIDWLTNIKLDTLANRKDGIKKRTSKSTNG